MGDALGSVRQLVSANGAVTLTRSYEPFGSTLNSAGAGTTAFQFAGEARDASGLVFLRARYFSTATGRFFTQDSWPGNAQMPGTLHPYLYGLNNPVRYTDPSGQCFTGAVIDAIICGAVAGAVVGGAVGAAVEYGRQVYQNYQHGHRGSEAWAECIDWGSVGRSALRGAGAGAAAGAAAPAAAYLFASGLGAEIAIGAAGGAAGNAAIQIGANALSGRPLGEGVAQAAVEGAIVGGASAAVVGIGSRVLRATSGGVSGGGSSFARNANSFTDEELAILGPEAGGGSGGGIPSNLSNLRGANAKQLAAALPEGWKIDYSPTPFKGGGTGPQWLVTSSDGQVQLRIKAADPAFGSDVWQLRIAVKSPTAASQFGTRAGENPKIPGEFWASFDNDLNPVHFNTNEAHIPLDRNITLEELIRVFGVGP